MQKAWRALPALLLVACGSSSPGAQTTDAGPGHTTDAGSASATDASSAYACSAPCGPVSLAQKQTNPWPIAVANGRVYWVDHTDPTAEVGVVRSVPTTGGTVTDLAMATSVRGEGAYGVAADEQNVYWTSGPSNGPNAIDMAPLGGDGGASSTLYTDPGIRGSVASVAAAGGMVYTQSSQGLVRIQPQGGVVTVVDANAECWGQILIDGQDLYCVGAGVTHYPLAGGAATTLVSATAFTPADVVAVGVDGATLYVMTYVDTSTTSSSSLYSLPRSGGAPTPLASGLDVKSQWFVANDAGLFWVAGVPGGTSFPLMQLPLAGGTPTVANPTGGANFIAGDARGVYLCDYYGDIDEYAF